MIPDYDGSLDYSLTFYGYARDYFYSYCTSVLWIMADAGYREYDIRVNGRVPSADEIEALFGQYRRVIPQEDYPLFRRRLEKRYARIKALIDAKN